MWEEARNLCQLAAIGDHNPALSWLSSNATSEAAPIVRAALSHLHPNADAPSAKQLQELMEVAPRFAAQIYARHLLRRSVCVFDTVELRRGLDAFESKHGTAPHSAVGRTWLRLFEGDHNGLIEAAQAAEQLAASQQIAPLVVEAACVRALAHLEHADTGAATREARRAFRMARTEELPQEQYLAGIVLARVRRFAHLGHLACRILNSLEAVASQLWSPWIQWELVVAGGKSEASANAFSVAVAADYFGRANQHLAAGETNEFESALAIAADEVTSVAFLAGEVLAFGQLTQPDLPPNDCNPLVRGWALGNFASPPRGLDCIGGELGHGDQPTSQVVVRKNGTSRRVLGISAKLVDVPVFTTSRPGRIETAASVLALCEAPGMPITDFFLAIYNFEFEAELHKSALEVVIHRLRELLKGHAIVERDGPNLQLQLMADFSVPDPRSKRSVDQEVLRSLAGPGAGTAKETAEVLGIPLRSVQHALKRLVADGMCEQERHGRGVRYQIEDTTFQEPSRLGPSPLSGPH